uniref:hypothetical protein n=1 Tax=Salmonella enterica TaxID=28901 RepID=UPI0020C388C5
IWTEWSPDLNLMKISRDCAAKNLYIPQTLLYQTDQLTAMRLGFGNQTLEEMKQSVRILAEMVYGQLKKDKIKYY